VPCRGTANTRIPRHPLLAILMTKEQGHHHRHVDCRRTPVRSTFRGRRPGIHDLTQTTRSIPPRQLHRNLPA
jgi:hypothetical protein